MVFLSITMVLLSNGCFLAETVLKGSILLILMALTSIMGHMCAPMFLAQPAAFLDFVLWNLKLVGIINLMLTFSGGFLSSFLHGFFLGIGIRYPFFNIFKNAQ
jgi:hypothetical protein